MKKTTEYEDGARRDDSKLWAECAAGSEEAREQLILANRPMVYWLAKKLKVPYNTYQDLIQEGMLALINAVMHVIRAERARGEPVRFEAAHHAP